MTLTEPTRAPVDSLWTRGRRLIWRSVRDHPGPHVVAMVGATLFAFAAVGLTVVLGRITDDVIVPAFDGDGIDRGDVWGAIAAIAAVGLVRVMGVMFRRFFLAVAEYRTQATWRTTVLDRYVDLPLSYHQTRPTGELLAHADSDLEAATMVLKPLAFTVGTLLLGAFALVSLLLVDPLLALIAVVLFPTLAVLNQIYTSRVEVPSAAAQAAVGDVSAIAHESFDGALVVKTLGRESAEVDRLAVAADRLRAERVAVGRLRSVFEPAIEALPNIGIVALLAVGSWLVGEGSITTGELVQAMALFTILGMPMRVVGFFLEEMPKSVVALDRADRVMDEPVPHRAGTQPMPAGPLAVAVDDVSFGYGDQQVLAELSFGVAAGESVAIVGSTGSGKSTLAELLVGLMDPDGGSIRIGGVEIGEADDLPSAASIVFQESFLFADTLRENITLGRDVTDDEFRRISRLCRAEDFVKNLERGYDTVVGERGVTLSGGQRQRIALARALVSAPRVLILDDATSAVDPLIEGEILAGLRRELHSTLVIIAYRLSTIRLADRVLYLAGGRLVADGSHEELLTIPAYAALVRAYEQAGTVQ